MVNITDNLLVRGVSSLSDKELLMLLLEDVPNVERVVDELFSTYGRSLKSLMCEDIARLRMVEGIGLKRAQRIVATAELGRRVSQESAPELTIITSSKDVVDYFRPKLGALPHEECWVLYLTSSNSVIESSRLSVGGVGATIVDHRLIIKRALELLATQIIMIHNHPSGAVEPSRDDVELTRRVNSAAKLFDIKLLDHIIVSSNGDYSFLNSNLL
ncbi:MAG: DNA repair protein RadC [Rikenellaceae bacterium]